MHDKLSPVAGMQKHGLSDKIISKQKVAFVTVSFSGPPMPLCGCLVAPMKLFSYG